MLAFRHYSLLLYPCSKIISFFLFTFYVLRILLTPIPLFSWAPKSLQMVTVAMKLKDTYSLEEKL